MSRLSIVIPVLGSLDGLEDTLVSVLENRPTDCQIVVVHNRPYDDPYDLKDEILFVQAPADAGLAAALNLAVAVSRGDIVHVLRCGVEVSPGWVDTVLPLFDDPLVGAVTPLVLEKADAQRVVTAGVGYWPGGAVRHLGQGQLLVAAARANEAPYGPDTLAGFYRRSALEAVGYFSDAVADPLAALDLALALRQAGFSCVLQPQCWTYVDRAATEMSPASALGRGWAAEWFFWRWAPVAGWFRSLGCHAMLLLGQCLQCVIRPRKILELAGRALAGFQVASHREHWRALRRPALSASLPAARPHFTVAAADDYSTIANCAESSAMSGACSSGPAAPRRLPG